MAEVLDCKGMNCPQPILRTAMKIPSLAAGTCLEVHADCSTFPGDITKWCSDNGKVLISVVDNGGSFVATLQI